MEICNALTVLRPRWRCRHHALVPVSALETQDQGNQVALEEEEEEQDHHAEDDDQDDEEDEDNDEDKDEGLLGTPVSSFSCIDRLVQLSCR